MAADNKTNNQQESRPQSPLLERIGEGLVEFGKDVVLFCDDHSTVVQAAVGVAVALGTAPFSGPAAIAIGAGAAFAMSKASDMIHNKADGIRHERAEKAAHEHEGKSDEHAKGKEGKGLENSQQQDQEPLNKGRKPHPPEAVNHHNKHAEHVKSDQEASKGKGGNGVSAG